MKMLVLTSPLLVTVTNSKQKPMCSRSDHTSRTSVCGPRVSVPVTFTQNTQALDTHIHTYVGNYKNELSISLSMSQRFTQIRSLLENVYTLIASIVNEWQNYVVVCWKQGILLSVSKDFYNKISYFYQRKQGHIYNNLEFVFAIIYYHTVCL